MQNYVISFNTKKVGRPMFKVKIGNASKLMHFGVSPQVSFPSLLICFESYIAPYVFNEHDMNILSFQNFVNIFNILDEM